MATYGDKAQEKVKTAMHERKKGTLKSGGSGKKVTNPKQAIAIGLSEARKEGGKVPPPKKSAREEVICEEDRRRRRRPPRRRRPRRPPRRRRRRRRPRPEDRIAEDCREEDGGEKDGSKEDDREEVRCPQGTPAKADRGAQGAGEEERLTSCGWAEPAKTARLSPPPTGASRRPQ